MKNRNQIMSLLLTAALVMTASCSSRQPLPTQEEIEQAAIQVPCIIALPVMTDLKSDDDEVRQGGEQEENKNQLMVQELSETMRRDESTGFPAVSAQQPDKSQAFRSAANLEKGAAYLDTQLKDALKGKDNVRFLSQRQLTSLLPATEMAQVALLSSIGSALKCNAVLVTTLSRYIQRVGGDYGVDSPASAAFSMKLFDTTDGSVIWSATFDETQQSFLSNIMSAL
ncbi:MAG: hypothetical protein P8X39_07395 [Desulfofustis sp.]